MANRNIAKKAFYAVSPLALALIVLRLVAEVFGGVFVLTGIFIMGGFLNTSAEGGSL